MKTKQQLYIEATERNVRRIKVEKYKTGYDLSAAKHALGIRQNDSDFDKELKTILKVSE